MDPFYMISIDAIRLVMIRNVNFVWSEWLEAFCVVAFYFHSFTTERNYKWSNECLVVFGHMAELQVAFQQRRLHLSSGLALGTDTRDNRGFRHSGSGGITAKEIIEHFSPLETRQADRRATIEQ